MEVPEIFIEFDLIKKIYEYKKDDYFIIETTHTSTFNNDYKNFLPDKFIFPCEFSKKQYEEFKIPTEVIEYEHEIPFKIPKKWAQEKLSLDSSFKHVINIGLFTPGKNQREVIELAKTLEDEKIIFHFIGNMAENYKYYWEPIVKNLPKNCKLWGERNDVDTFYSAADLMLFSSTEELNPLCIKEAISHRTPVLCRNLPTYLNKYSTKDGVEFVNTSTLKNDVLKILNLTQTVDIIGTVPKIKIVHLLSLPSTEREIKSVQSVAPLAQFGVRYIQHINPPTTILPEELKQKNRPSLTPGHLGCFSAFRSAIQKEFDDVDFLLICEADCKLLTSHKVFYENLLRATEEITKNRIGYFSFGDTHDLEAGVFQSEYVEGGFDNDFCFQTHRVIGLQSVMFPKVEEKYLNQQFIEEPWTGPDIWFNNIFRKPGKVMGIVKKRLTTQFDGISLIDNQPKKLL
jgi:hypothetical protein